jgi:hypothetical protein
LEFSAFKSPRILEAGENIGRQRIEFGKGEALFAEVFQ